MATSPEALVTPAVLVWARVSSRLEVAAAAARVGVPADRLVEWESGETRPTIRQLETIARVYRRSLNVFFLEAPPVENPPPHDFRSVKGKPVVISPELAFELRHARERREIAVEVAEKPPKRFSLKASVDDDVYAVARRIRRATDVDVETQAEWGDSSLRYWKSAVEALDVLVFETRSLKVEEARGFCISEVRFPVIALNGADARSARVFTLIHELAHLMLGVEGVCLATSPSSPSSVVIETFCNAVAAETLVPRADISAQFAERSARESIDQLLAFFKRRYGVSEEVVVIRMRDLGLITGREASARQQLLNARAKSASGETKERTGGPPPHIRTLKANGRRFTREVLSAFDRDAISIVDVARFLSTKVDHLDALSAGAWAPA